jgi:hypothetical protein
MARVRSSAGGEALTGAGEVAGALVAGRWGRRSFGFVPSTGIGSRHCVQRSVTFLPAIRLAKISSDTELF